MSNKAIELLLVHHVQSQKIRKVLIQKIVIIKTVLTQIKSNKRVLKQIKMNNNQYNIKEWTIVAGWA